MSELRHAVEEYLALRRSLGFDLRDVALLLQGFTTFADHEGATHVTVDVALRWATQSKAKESATLAARLHAVRGFARWRYATDPRTEVPPPDLLPSHYHRKRPYIYSDEEIDRLLLAARRLRSPVGLRGLTYFTLLGVLVVTGMRVKEVVGLDRQDVDLAEAVLTIRHTKFRKSRLVPIAESTRQVLTTYAAERDRRQARRPAAAFFVAETGGRLTHWAVRDTFVKVSRQIGLRSSLPGQRYGHGPRLHDLRHRFAVRTLVDWYRAGVNVEHHLPYLATYLGHVHVNDTYWYLEAVPELLALATQRLLDGGKETAR